MPSLTNTFADYCFAEFRKSTGLWFDLNEQPPTRGVVDVAHLLDGESFLTLWVTESPCHNREEIASTRIEGQEAYVYAVFDAGSRRVFGQTRLREIANAAVEEFHRVNGSAVNSSSDVSLLSFTATYKTGAVHEVGWACRLARLLGGEHQAFPRNNLFLPCPEMSLELEDDKQWLQIQLTVAVRVTEVVAALRDVLSSGIAYRGIGRETLVRVGDTTQCSALCGLRVLSRRR